MFILSYISRALGFWSVNNISIYKSSEWKAFKNIKFLCEISNKCSSDLLGANVYKTLESIN